MNFEFAAPTRIIFGEGALRQAGALAASLGTRALVVLGSSGRDASLGQLLQASGVATTVLRVASEPTTGLAEQGAQLARAERCDLVVALGGGSVIDAGKAIAALITNRAPILEYLETVGGGRPLTERPVPFIAIPTTAGTGAETTRNAVLLVEAYRVKVSLRSPLMLPSIALIDPILTLTLPPSVTASTGLDALTQCIEPFVSRQANPLSDAVAREGMGRAAGALLRAFRNGADMAARRDMAVASLCGGLALANARLGAVHGFAAPLGGMFPIPHGVACARLLPPVVAANIHALRDRAADSPALARYDEVARILTGRATARAEDAIDWLSELAEELQVPALSAFGMTSGDIAAVVEKARQANSMQGNPITLTDGELASALERAV